MAVTFRITDAGWAAWLAAEAGAASITISHVAFGDNGHAIDDEATTQANSGAIDIPVLDNDSDPDGDALTVTAVTQPANGSVVITPGGASVTFEPADGFDVDTLAADMFD